MSLDLTAFRNAGEAFAARAAQYPDRVAVSIYRGEGAREHASVTFAELARRAWARAEVLDARLAPGDRVIIALPTCIEFVELYLACLYAGMTAVPAPAPGGSASAIKRVARIAGDCAPALAITTGGGRPLLAEQLRKHGFERVPVEEAWDISSYEGPGRPPAPRRPPGPDTLAVLQYSSGSIGDPKGVMLAHGDILANLMAWAAGTGFGADDAVGSWIPLHHDMGLFCQLSPGLFFGASVALMSPTDFVRRPAAWLRMMHRLGSTVTAAPNFAYDLCQRVIPDELADGLDLSALRVVLNASEPIHPPAMAAFSRRFERAGLRADAIAPAYGLAECTAYVSGKPVGRPPTVLVADSSRLASADRPELRPSSGSTGKEMVGVGRPAGLEARIVNPGTCRELPGGAIGEIWLRGPGVGRGYWNQREASELIFGARLAGSGDAEPGWVRTGDLGALLDGELFITGRIKEMMTVRGRNLYPQDLEEEARAAHEALCGFVGAAFGVAAPDERIVLVHEIRPRVPGSELPAIAAAVTRRLAVTAGTPVRNIMLVRRGTVRRTTSGKIQRGVTRARFLAGEIVPLYANLEPDILAIVGRADENDQVAAPA
jgi:acyl-CoA synthetase (AMP-forming)/AMP-acid ligase II